MNQNPIAADGTDDGFSAAKVIHAFSNYLDCLVKHSLSDRLVARFQPDEERRAALDIETERNLLLRRPDRRDAKNDEQQHERHREQAFPRPMVRGEVPPEENEHGQTDAKCKRRAHWSFDVRLSILDLLINSSLSWPSLSWRDRSLREGGNLLTYASFNTLVMADLSISIFTLSATFSSTVFSFTFAMRP